MDLEKIKPGDYDFELPKNEEQLLKKYGVEIKSDEDIAKMSSYKEYISYKADAKNQILNAQQAMTKEDLEASEIIFNKALGKLDSINNPDEFDNFRKTFGFSEKN